jgi:hypothetical protein
VAYDPERRHDAFVLLGSAAAALADEIAADLAERHGARYDG